MDTDSAQGHQQDLATEIRAIHRLLKQRVREHGASGKLTSAQVTALVRLERDGATTMSNLARVEAIRPQSMREIVTPLLEAGLVGTAPDPHDGRQTLLSLTSDGVTWIREGRAASHDWLTQSITHKLSGKEQAALRDALALLRKVVEE